MKKENIDPRNLNSDFDEKALDALIQEALTDDVFVNVPEGFADLMEEKAKQINLFLFWQEAVLKHAAILGGAVVMLSIVLGVLYYFSAESISGILVFLNQFKWLLLGGFSSLFLFQMADSWIMKRLGIAQR